MNILNCWVIIFSSDMMQWFKCKIEQSKTTDLYSLLPRSRPRYQIWILSSWFWCYTLYMCPAPTKIYQIINIFRMIFVCHYVIVPFNPQYLPKHSPLILQGGGIQSGRIWWLRTHHFSLHISLDRKLFIKSLSKFFSWDLMI